MADNPRRILPPTETGPPETESSRHHRSGPFGVVDIGTTKIACLIGRIGKRRLAAGPWLWLAKGQGAE